VSAPDDKPQIDAGKPNKGEMKLSFEFGQNRKATADDKKGSEAVPCNGILKRIFTACANCVKQATDKDKH